MSNAAFKIALVEQSLSNTVISKVFVVLREDELKEVQDWFTEAGYTVTLNHKVLNAHLIEIAEPEIDDIKALLQC